MRFDRIHLEDETRLHELHVLQTRIDEYRHFLKIIEEDIEDALKPRNHQLVHDLVSNARNNEADARLDMLVDWSKIQRELELFQQERMLDILKQ